MWWRYLVRAFRGRQAARAWDATVTAPVELAKVLFHDAAYTKVRRELEIRRMEVTERHRIETEAAEREWQEERERRWREMTTEERQEGARVLEVKAWKRKAKGQ